MDMYPFVTFPQEHQVEDWSLFVPLDFSKLTQQVGREILTLGAISDIPQIRPKPFLAHCPN